MHIEVQVALNFVISYLYNKLPRRRVNIFGEELEKALKDKFQGHWYPDKPFKGSAFRCLKTGDPIDKVLERAARESGVPIQDILENLPQELAVWVDPGEVSYRIGEKGAVKILFSDKVADPQDDCSTDGEVTKTFNPEAQCFRPIEAVSCGLNGLSLSPNGAAAAAAAMLLNGGGQQAAAVAAAAAQQQLQLQAAQQAAAPGANARRLPSPAGAASPTAPGAGPYKGSQSPAPPPPPAAAFMPRSTAPLTFTTATFAQTKFGSTKLKTSSKRANSRMSPTEFSNYIKQRAMQQQLHQQPGPQPQQHHSPGGRALSPDPSAFYFPAQLPPPRLLFESSSPYLGPADAYPGGGPQAPAGGYYPPGPPAAAPASAPPAAAAAAPQDQAKLLDNGWPYAGQYQHLLVAN